MSLSEISSLDINSSLLNRPICLFGIILQWIPDLPEKHVTASMSDYITVNCGYFFLSNLLMTWFP